LQIKAIHAAMQERPSTPQAMVERIVKLVKQHASGTSQHDDMTLVCFCRTTAA
jgi:serine phosphatase RsbU (regulator of sigma subunit)